METLLKRLDNIRKEAIEKLLSSGDQVIHNEYESADELYDLPYVAYVGKHFDYHQYAILSYKIVGDGIEFNAIETGEVGDYMTFGLNEVTTQTLCELVDLLNEKK